MLVFCVKTVGLKLSVKTVPNFSRWKDDSKSAQNCDFMILFLEALFLGNYPQVSFLILSKFKWIN